VGAAADLKKPLQEWPISVPLLVPMVGDDRSFEKAGAFQLDASATRDIVVTVPPHTTLVIDSLLAEGGDLFSQEKLVVAVIVDGVVQNIIADLQRTAAPLAIFETFLPQRFTIEAPGDTPRTIGLRLTNGAANGKVFGSFAISGWQTSVSNTGSSA
jgi:hypothetical protein